MSFWRTNGWISNNRWCQLLGNNLSWIKLKSKLWFIILDLICILRNMLAFIKRNRFYINDFNNKQIIGLNRIGFHNYVYFLNLFPGMGQMDLQIHSLHIYMKESFKTWLHFHSTCSASSWSTLSLKENFDGIVILCNLHF